MSSKTRNIRQITAAVAAEYPTAVGDNAKLSGAIRAVSRHSLYVKSTSHIPGAIIVNGKSPAAQIAGVVLDVNTLDVLAMPGKPLSNSVRMSSIIKHGATYDIVPISDGTTVTLYYHNGAWRMSTTHGIDVSGLRLMGSRTYRELFDEVVAEYEGFNFDALDTSMSYTVGFRHHDIHPLIDDPQRAWFVHAFDCAAYNRGEPVAPSHPDIGIPRQAVVPFAESTLTDMLDRNSDSVKSYLKCDRAHQWYGFILRSKGAFNDIIVESELYKLIRQGVYDLKPALEGIPAVTADNRLDFIKLSVYLSYIKLPIFRQIMPHWNADFDRYDEIFKDLRTAVARSLSTGGGDVGAAGLLDSYVVYIVEQLQREIGDINAFDTAGLTVLKNFIVDPMHLGVWFGAIHCA